MKKKHDGQKLSDSLSEICKLLDSAPKDYAWNMEQATEMDRLTQDYLHKLELDGLKYEERAKVATKIAKCRQQRRVYKDAAQILEPLARYLSGDKGRQTYNMMREILGQTRKIEEHMTTRVYYPRVLGKGNP